MIEDDFISVANILKNNYPPKFISKYTWERIRHDLCAHFTDSYPLSFDKQLFYEESAAPGAPKRSSPDNLDIHDRELSYDDALGQTRN
jgi:hypothetical protein